MIQVRDIAFNPKDGPAHCIGTSRVVSGARDSIPPQWSVKPSGCRRVCFMFLGLILDLTFHAFPIA